MDSGDTYINPQKDIFQFTQRDLNNGDKVWTVGALKNYINPQQDIVQFTQKGLDDGDKVCIRNKAKYPAKKESLADKHGAVMRVDRG